MRQILIDFARAEVAQKRGAGAPHVDLAQALDQPDPVPQPMDFLDLDAALNDLAQLAPRQAKVVELRYFGGAGKCRDRQHSGNVRTNGGQRLASVAVRATRTEKLMAIPDDYQRASDLFNELLDVPDGERDAALNAACGENVGLRAEVTRLLHADRSAAGFLDRGAMRDASLLLKPSGVPETIAHYKILSKLGEGGMGEVWRALDCKLEREVAIKFLPDSFAADPDRVARFSREAQVLASLSHPNIAVIYGVEDRALIMELVDGPTLAERIAAGPDPVGGSGGDRLSDR